MSDVARQACIERTKTALLAGGLHQENVAGGLLPDDRYAQVIAAIALDALLVSPGDLMELIGTPLGVVQDAGGGMVDVWVHRELASYPRLGATVFVLREKP